MKKRNSGAELDARIVYGDIIDLPHWQSKKHPHMSLYDRAAQFSPFAALSGYDEMISEESRIVDNKIELDEESLEKLNRELSKITQLVEEGKRPAVTITYFIPDLLKQGGRYETITENVRKIDTVMQNVVLEKKAGRADMYVEIGIEDILELYIAQ